LSGRSANAISGSIIQNSVKFRPELHRHAAKERAQRPSHNHSHELQCSPAR
jgi:hypothetical protein